MADSPFDNFQMQQLEVLLADGSLVNLTGDVVMFRVTESGCLHIAVASLTLEHRQRIEDVAQRSDEDIKGIISLPASVTYVYASDTWQSFRHAMDHNQLLLYPSLIYIDGFDPDTSLN